MNEKFNILISTP